MKDTQIGNASTLILRDGTKYTGEFRNGEITGRGVKVWPDGRVYQGEFLEGEMHGQGMLQYSIASAKQTDLKYAGNFHLNSREGQGVLTKRNGDVYEGNFVSNHPNGNTVIRFCSGDNYEGEVIKGVMTGNGFLECGSGKCFTGEFKDGQLHGNGKFFVKDGSYSLEGQFQDGTPELRANKYVFNVSTPVPEAEDAPKAGGGKKDAKGKGAPIATAPVVDEGIETGNEIKLCVDNANPEEGQRVLKFGITVVFQGEPYEDPNPPEVDEAAAKKGGKGKVADEPEVRMITPSP